MRSSSIPSSSIRCSSKRSELGEAGGLHRVGDDVLRPVLLGVEERVGHAERHLVAQLRRAEGVGVDQGRLACGVTLSRVRPVDARARALELVDQWHGELQRLLPCRAPTSSTPTFTSGTTSTAWSATTTSCSSSWTRYGISRAFMFCLDEPDRHPAFTRGERPHARVRGAVERPADPVRAPRPERVADRGGAPLPRRRRAAGSSSTRARRSSRRPTSGSGRCSSSRPSGACRS